MRHVLGRQLEISYAIAREVMIVLADRTERQSARSTPDELHGQGRTAFAGIQSRQAQLNARKPHDETAVAMTHHQPPADTMPWEDTVVVSETSLPPTVGSASASSTPGVTADLRPRVVGRADSRIAHFIASSLEAPYLPAEPVVEAQALVGLDIWGF